MIFFSCAAVMSPPGGPKDEIPPELIEIIPSDGTTHFRGGVVELVFSEYLDENTVEGAINILPSLEEKPKIIYKGKRLFVEFPDKLIENQTYIISIDRDLSDEHRVKFAQGVQVALSTGSQIDQGSIAGKIEYSKDASLNLWKVRDPIDYLKFYERKPDYVFDASNEGEYEFKYLSSGEYRLVAVDRSVSGIPISLERITYGLSWLPDIKIRDQERLEGINIRLLDKQGSIKMINAESFQESWGRISFSGDVKEIVDEIPLAIRGEDSVIIDADYFQDPGHNSKLYFVTDNPIDDYVSILIDGLKKNNITVVESGKIRLKMESVQDTMELSVIQPKSKYMLDIELGEIKPLKIIFSNLIQAGLDKNSFSIMKDTILIPFDMHWESPLSLNLFPNDNWEPNTAYNLRILRDLITPIFGKDLKDSITSIDFKTSNYFGFGSLIINSNIDSNKLVIAELKNVEKIAPVFRSVVNSNGNTSMINVPEGNYFLMFFKDIDNNMKYSSGNIHPYVSSEWFYNYPDTLKIRSNWDMELEVINIMPF
ncbi:MAG: Ig-like domain-containing protein [Candidatus Neomarinimicrobiota bacterium]